MSVLYHILSVTQSHADRARPHKTDEQSGYNYLSK